MRKHTVDVLGKNRPMERICINSKSWMKKASKLGTPENLEAQEIQRMGCFFVDATDYSIPMFEKMSRNPYFGESLRPVAFPMN